jgi:hypothetical protein
MKKRRAWIPKRVINQNRLRLERLEAELREIATGSRKELIEVRFIKRTEVKSPLVHPPLEAEKINETVYRLAVPDKQSDSFKLPYGWTWADCFD